MTCVTPYIKAAFCAITALAVLAGILLLAMQNCQAKQWLKWKDRLSVGLSAIGTLVFIAAMQPYAAVFAFGILVIKGFLLIKKA